MQVEIWSDVVCPWCAVGKRRFETAWDGFSHADEVEVVWRSFELDPAAPRERHVPTVEHLAAKYQVSRAEAQAMNDRMTEVAAEEGLAFRLDIARGGNTFDAHRLLHLARERGLQDAMKERLLLAYLCEGEAVGDRDVLARLAADVGLDADEAADVLAGDAYANAVRTDEADARALGITAVPFFVVDRAYGVSGAQPPEVLSDLLEQTWTQAHSLTTMGAGGDDCADGSCAV